MDEFSIMRLTRLLETYKLKHGRDITEAELEHEGFANEVVGKAVNDGMLDKYQVTNEKGSRENRYKLHHDWRSLK